MKNMSDFVREIADSGVIEWVEENGGEWAITSMEGFVFDFHRGMSQEEVVFISSLTLKRKLPLKMTAARIETP